MNFIKLKWAILLLEASLVIAFMLFVVLFPQHLPHAVTQVIAALDAELFVFGADTQSVFPLISGGLILFALLILFRAYLLYKNQKMTTQMRSEINRLQIQLADLKRMAYLDCGTGLPNRFKLLEMLDMTLEKERGGLITLCIMDLDDLKNINDTLGHKVGDQIIAILAGRLKLLVDNWQALAQVRVFLSRIGGDEFALVITGVENKVEIQSMLQQLLDNFREKIELSCQQLSVGVSIGISMSSEHGDTSDNLLKKADMAMYKVKQSGKHSFKFFKEEYLDELKQRMRIEQELALAIKRDEFVVYYQPVIDVAMEKEIGFEALIRWNHPEKGMVAPDEFIPVAEETGLIVAIGDWVIRQVCSDLALLKIDNPEYFIAINVAPQQLADHGFAHHVSMILALYDIPSDKIHFELTESTLMSTSTHNLRTLRALNQLGIKLWIDDFGTGYSSFSYLHQFNFYGLKLDRSFIESVIESKKSQNIVKGICSMGQSLRLELLGEGIEDPRQAEFLLNLGCSQVQGYWYARPMPFKDLRMWLADQAGVEGAAGSFPAV